MSIMAEGEESHSNSPSLTSKFQRMYKVASPSVPSWKEAYRKRCQERLANSRQSLLERFRWNVDSSADDVGSARTSAIRDLVLSEWKAFKQENCQQARADEAVDSEENEYVDVESDDIDSLLSVVEEVTAELLREEEQILAEYEARNRFDDEALCASISRLTTDELICPVCTKSPLFVNKGVVFCQCGVRINTENVGRCPVKLGRDSSRQPATLYDLDNDG